MKLVLLTLLAAVALVRALEKRDIALQPLSARDGGKIRRHFELLEPEPVRRGVDNINNQPHHLTKRAVDVDGINQNSTGPAPYRGSLGGPFYHPSNTAIDKQNPDYYSPSNTDAGVVPNLKWSFSHSHTRLLNGGWVREQTITDLPTSVDFAAAELSLNPGSYRELHWHRVTEWAIVLNGKGRIAALDSQGRTSVDDVQTGDLWYFPPGAPHSIQAANDQPLEFLVLFGDGNFDAAGTTFMLDDWVAHTPKEVVAQNLGVNVSVLSTVPQKDPYIVRPTKPSPDTATEAKIDSPNGDTNGSFVYHLSQVQADQKKGGYVKIADSTTFPQSIDVAAALVSVEPGGLRELHWHAKAEWFYVISGQGRITAFAGGATARTFDVQVGDSGVIPTAYGHYVQNHGNETLTFIEVFKGIPRFSDFSLTQWLALAPRQVVADTLNVSTSVIDQLVKEKQTILAPVGY